MVASPCYRRAVADPTAIHVALSTLEQTKQGGDAYTDLTLSLSQAIGHWPASQLAMGLLVLFSVVSWGIIIYKAVHIRTARAQSEDFLEAFWQAKRLDSVYQQSEQFQKSPISQTFRAGYIELARLKKTSGEDQTMLGDGIENVERALRRAQNSEALALLSLTSFLATVGSTSPFIGLFGTVWGVMKAFNDIGRMGSANLATVAPGISEALIATAVGLVAAIPAVIAYNYFLSSIKTLESEMDSFASDFLNIVKRHFFR
jgi:biopolymer transport protein TolQ